MLFHIGMTSAAFLGHAFQAYIGEFKIIGWVFSALMSITLCLRKFNANQGFF